MDSKSFKLVFKPRLGWTIWFWGLVIVAGMFVLACQFISGEYDWKFLVSNIVIFALFFTVLYDYLNGRWVVDNRQLININSKGKSVTVYEIDKIEWVRVRRARIWEVEAQWPSKLVEIGFADRSQTKSILPVAIGVKDTASLVDALIAVNRNIIIKK